MKNNGLELITIKSEAKTLPPHLNVLDNISEMIKIDSFAIAYMDYKVLIGRYENGKFIFYNNESFEPKYLQRLRIFNNLEELLIWRSGDGFKGRIRKDNVGKEVDVVEARQVLFGTKSEPYGVFTKIYEEQGCELLLPFNINLDNKNKEQPRIFIKTRNYIEYLNDDCQASYGDCRFVNFTDEINDLK
jgi:CRISPR-associated protein (TIGR03984 family)